MYDKKSFLQLDQRHSRLLETVSNQCVMVFVGTKLDLLNKKLNGKTYTREVTFEESTQQALEFSDRWSSKRHPLGMLPSFETSSKQNQNVNDVFEYIFETILPSSARAAQRTPSPSGLIRLDPNSKEDSGCHEQTKSKCCRSG